MKLNLAEVTTSGNFKKHSVKAGISPERLAIVMDLLIRNYNSPQLATLREWVSNAIDSHVASGSTKPVLVTLPTRMNPMLVVQDFGLGMSYDDMVNVYSQFDSTKDGENDSIGAFGIGGKSALAISDQYSLVGVKDGLKNVFVLSRAGGLQGLSIEAVVYNQPTDEPNGVTVSVGTGNSWNFHKSDIDSVLFGWTSDQVELTNSEFESVYDNHDEFNSGFAHKSLFDYENGSQVYGRGYHNLRILVGTVAYTITDEMYNAISKKLTDRKFWEFISNNESYIVVKLPIGSVTFPSSREVIENTDANVDVLIAKLEELYSEMTQRVQKKIDTLSSLSEAWSFAKSRVVKQLKLDIEYEGIKLHGLKLEGETVITVNGASKDSFRLQFDKEFQTTSVDNTAFVLLMTEDELKLSQETVRKHLRPFVIENWDTLASKKIPHYHTMQILVARAVDRPHTELSTVHTFEEIRKLSAKVSTVAKRNAPVDWRARAEKIFVSGGQKPEARYSHGDLGAIIKERSGSLPKIVSTRDEYSSTVDRALMQFLGLTPEDIISTSTRTDLQTIRKGFPEILELDAYLSALPKLELARAVKRFKDAYKLVCMLQLSYGLPVYNKLLSEGKLPEVLTSLVTDDALKLATYVSRLRQNGGKLPEYSKFAVFKKVFDFNEKNLFSYHSGPFSMIHWSSARSNSSEIVAYLEWSAIRYKQANS